MPKTFETYYEPFLGGGALFFNRCPGRAVLYDSNARLIRTYSGLRDDPSGVIQRLREFEERHSKSFYLKQRERNIDQHEDTEVAAWFIYLNKTGFNGLYRVNRKNRFNVPLGAYEKPLICDEQNLRACAQALKHADLVQADFETVEARAQPGDFVYFDPPYVPLSVTSSFTSYTSDGFSMEDHTRLRDLARKLKRKGVHVLLSNSSAPAVRELYAKGFKRPIEVQANRMVNCKGNGRGEVTELLIH